MPLWPMFVEWLQAGIFTLAQVLGGNVGLGIVGLSLMIRLAMLPLTFHLARRSQAHRGLLRQLQPELDRLRERWRDRPEKLARETLKVFERHGARPVDGTGVLGALVQMPIVFGLFSAVRKSLAGGGRFAWIADIARPDALLTVGVAALTYLTVTLQADPTAPQGRWLAVASVLLTLTFLSKMAAGVGLYWGTSAAVGLLQVVLLKKKG